MTAESYGLRVSGYKRCIARKVAVDTSRGCGNQYQQGCQNEAMLHVLVVEKLILIVLEGRNHDGTPADCRDDQGQPLHGGNRLPGDIQVIWHSLDLT